jgi:hypothetical protein
MKNPFADLDPEIIKRLAEYAEPHKPDAAKIRQVLKQLGIEPEQFQRYLMSNPFSEYFRSPSALKTTVAKLESKPAPQSAKSRRWKASVGTHAAARRMEAYIESKGLDLKGFARRAGTTDRTLRKFRKTGLVRRSVFDEIARAMGLTRDELLKS